MDILVILLGFAILSGIFLWLSREVREVNPYLSIIFLVGSVLFLIFVATTVYQAASVGDEILANKTITYNIVNQSLNHSTFNSTGDLQGWDMVQTPVTLGYTEVLAYSNSTRFAALAVDSPIIVLEWLVFLLIAVFMLMEIIKLLQAARRMRQEGMQSGI